eukprot:scaffold656_cov403-Pavlova_lutheri.AAC.35
MHETTSINYMKRGKLDGLLCTLGPESWTLLESCSVFLVNWSQPCIVCFLVQHPRTASIRIHKSLLDKCGAYKTSGNSLLSQSAGHESSSIAIENSPLCHDSVPFKLHRKPRSDTEENGTTWTAWTVPIKPLPQDF